MNFLIGENFEKDSTRRVELTTFSELVAFVQGLGTGCVEIDFNKQVIRPLKQLHWGLD